MTWHHLPMRVILTILDKLLISNRQLLLREDYLRMIRLIIWIERQKLYTVILVRWSHIVFMLWIHSTILETKVIRNETPTVILMYFRWWYYRSWYLVLDRLWQNKIVILFSSRSIVARNRNLFWDCLYCLFDTQLLFYFLILPIIKGCCCSSLILQNFCRTHLSSCHPAHFKIL